MIEADAEDLLPLAETDLEAEADEADFETDTLDDGGGTIDDEIDVDLETETDDETEVDLETETETDEEGGGTTELMELERGGGTTDDGADELDRGGGTTELEGGGATELDTGGGTTELDAGGGGGATEDEGGGTTELGAPPDGAAPPEEAASGCCLFIGPAIAAVAARRVKRTLKCIVAIRIGCARVLENERV